MDLTIALFKEYIGRSVDDVLIELPYLKLDWTQVQCSDSSEIVSHNIKVFCKDLERRSEILEVFLSKGFEFVTDHITTTWKDKENNTTYVIVSKDRLIFNG